MPRTMTASAIAAVELQSSQIIHLLEMEFSGGTIRFAAGASDIDWNSVTWTASGANVNYRAAIEGADLRGQSLDVAFDGVDVTIIGAFLAEDYIGRYASLYRAHIAADGTVIPDPVLLFKGLMNNQWEVIEDIDGRSCRIETTFQSPLVKFAQVRGIRADKNSLVAKFTGDTFFRHITKIPDGDIGWGFYSPGGIVDFIGRR